MHLPQFYRYHSVILFVKCTEREKSITKYIALKCSLLIKAVLHSGLHTIFAVRNILTEQDAILLYARNVNQTPHCTETSTFQYNDNE